MTNLPMILDTHNNMADTSNNNACVLLFSLTWIPEFRVAAGMIYW